jgi:hypothetical protein
MSRFILRGGFILFLLAVSGCGFLGSEPERVLQDLAEANNNLADVLHRIQDPESAKASIDELDEKFGEMIEIFQSLPEVKKRNKNVVVDQETLAELMKAMQKSTQRVKNELERLRTLRGLPMEFWKVGYRRGLDLAAAFIEFAGVMGKEVPPKALEQIQQARDLFNRNGFEKMICLEFTNLPADLREKAMEKIREAASGAALYPNTGAGGINEWNVILSPAPDFKVLVKSLDIGRVVFEDEPQRRIHIEVNRLKLGARANSDEEERRLFQEDLERKIKNHHQEIEMSSIRNMVEIAAEKKKHDLPDSSDPRYYDKLADRLADTSSDSFWERKKVIDILVSTDPLKVTSVETRKKIARAFKQIAEDEHGFDQEKGIEGLVVWGGKYSVPILLKMLDERHSFVQEKIIRALGELKDPRAAASLAELLSDFHYGRAAYNALREIGPAAEDALLEVAPSSDPDLCLAAVKLLGECGTSKSLSILREGAGSRNPYVRDAARIALKKVINREKEKKSAAAKGP